MQAVVACNATVPRVCTLVLFIVLGLGVTAINCAVLRESFNVLISDLLPHLLYSQFGLKNVISKRAIHDVILAMLI